MSEPCCLRQGEGYAACDDDVVSKCALRGKFERFGVPETLKFYRFKQLCNKFSKSDKSVLITSGNTFSKIAPS